MPDPRARAAHLLPPIVVVLFLLLVLGLFAPGLIDPGLDPHVLLGAVLPVGVGSAAVLAVAEIVRARQAILTGMGRDGARGLKSMRDAGCYTVGQSQASALVYGMPRVAFEEGAVVEQAPVEAIAARLANALVRLKSAA